MIRSMTGFGRHEEIIDGRSILVEIKSVNHRYFEFSTKVSREYSFIENKLKKFVNKRISRGKVDVLVNIKTFEDENAEIIINYPLALGYIKALNELKEKYHLKDDISVTSVSKYPDILTVKGSDAGEDKILNDILSVAEKSFDKLMLMKEKEGASLQDDIQSKLLKIMNTVNLVENKLPLIISNYEKKLKARIYDLMSGYDIDEQRVMMEVAIFADKIAIDEEIVRLKSHIKQLDKMLKSNGETGRKMDFILQEMNRETNTIGSKSADSEISHMVVDIKANIEKIREQVQNIE